MNAPADLDRDLQALVDGELAQPRFDEVQQLLKSDPVVLKRYLEIVRTDHLLREHEHSPSNVVAFPVRAIRAVLAIAAALALAFIFFWPHSQAPVAEAEAEDSLPTLEFTPGAVFKSEAADPRSDGRIQTGDLVAMREGFVSITLPSGVEAVIESPSDFSILPDNQFQLDRGRAWFRVPEAAIGFTVQLPWMEVVDLGTVFTTVADGEHNEVQVQEGLVEVRMRDGSGPRELVAGETLSQNRIGNLQISSGEPLADRNSGPERETLFHEVLGQVPNQPLTQRNPMVGNWEIIEGHPRVVDGKFDAGGEDTLVFGHLSEPLPSQEDAVLLVSFRSRSPENFFHSEGWAGIGLFDGERELVFFGDKSNDSYSWALIPYGLGYIPEDRIAPRHDLNIQGGEAIFTLRYRQKTGHMEVFRGWGVQGVPVLEVLTDPGLRVDRIRIANGLGGDFSFDEILVSVVR